MSRVLLVLGLAWAAAITWHNVKLRHAQRIRDAIEGS